MRFVHYLPLVAAVAAGVVLLTGAGHRRGAPTGATSPFTPPPPAAVDPAASQAVDAALATLDPRHVIWIETTVRQKVRLSDLHYDAEGRFRAAPNNRFRLELHAEGGASKSTILAVGDGTSVWRASRSGKGDWTDVHRVGMKLVLDGLAAAPETRAAFFHGPTFTGPEPLLHNLRRSMVWVKRGEVTQAGKRAVELTGVWPDEFAAALTANGSPWPDGLPDRCRLYLDPDTLWPRRVEWWGPGASGKTLVRLVQLELRDPVLNHPLSPLDCARTFTFDPGKAEVSDETTTVKEGLAVSAAPR